MSELGNHAYFWAKTLPDSTPGLSVLDHMLNVGQVALALAKASPGLLMRFGLTPEEVAALAALHDLGKISPGFQRKCLTWLVMHNLTEADRNWRWAANMESDHGKVTHAALQNFLVAVGVSRSTAQFLAAVLGGHHGHVKPPNARGYQPGKAIDEDTSGIDWNSARNRHAEIIWDLFKPDTARLTFDDQSPALWWLAGLTSVADWIGSDECFFPQDNQTDSAAATQLAVDSLGFTASAFIQNLSFEDIFGFAPNAMQQQAMAAITGPGVYVIEAPMGLGKTEAALAVAYNLICAGGAHGIYFALPTQATSNRIHLRMNDFLKCVSPQTGPSRLIHGNSWLMQVDQEFNPASTEDSGPQDQDARAGRDWFASAKRALLAPFGVGTIDQALLGVVAAKHFFVRHFALAGKVIIIDEVHSYDVYTGTLIDKLITSLEGLGCTVIILSATLSGQRRARFIEGPELPAYPLISGRCEGRPIEAATPPPPTARAVAIEFHQADTAMAQALALAESGGAVLWICDTVDTAQAQYRRFKETATNGLKLGLLHSRFTFKRREQLEDEWMLRLGRQGDDRRGSILVSTQIVEQSVDLDADLIVSELAPTDMLLQRLGRLWRHPRPERPCKQPRFIITNEEQCLEELKRMKAPAIEEALGAKARVYSPYVLLRSLEIWQQLSSITIPTDIRGLIEATYADRADEPEAWQQLFSDWWGTASAKRMKATFNSNFWNLALDDQEGVQTRLNEMPTVDLVLCRSCNAQAVTFFDGSAMQIGDEFRFESAQAIHRNLVKAPRHVFTNVDVCQAFAPYLYGEQCVGLVEAGGNIGLKGLKDGCRIVYSDEFGLVINHESGKENP